MSKYLDRAKEIRAIESPHYNCAQSVLVPFAEEAGIDHDTAMKMGANFGSGMRLASVCGAFTGGLMTLGLFGVDDPKVVADFANRIKNNHEGFIECRDLLRINHEKGLPKKPHCDSMVYESIGIVEDILREKGKIS
ncbi:MAG: C-GCAxxG-C-C family protein [Lachnospiraceae bacterium]|nr:C-GCAxxG-C-C family protein [Lachnospiraceae bacterium]